MLDIKKSYIYYIIVFIIFSFAAVCFSKEEKKSVKKETAQKKVIKITDDDMKDLPSTKLKDDLTSEAAKKNEAKEDIKEENAPKEEKSYDDSIFKDFDDFELPDLDDRNQKTSELKKDRWAIIKFGASWCPPCRAETEELKKIYDKYKESELRIIEVSMESKSDAKKYHEKSGAKWINLIDEKNEAAKKFNIIYIPTIIIVNPNNKVVQIGNFLTFGQIEKILKQNGF